MADTESATGMTGLIAGIAGLLAGIGSVIVTLVKTMRQNRRENREDAQKEWGAVLDATNKQCQNTIEYLREQLREASDTLERKRDVVNRLYDIHRDCEVCNAELYAWAANAHVIMKAQNARLRAAKLAVEEIPDVPCRKERDMDLASNLRSRSEKNTKAATEKISKVIKETDSGQITKGGNS